MSIVETAFATQYRASHRARIIDVASEALLRPVPAVSARTLAACRVLLGALLMFFLVPRGAPGSDASISSLLTQSYADSDMRYVLYQALWLLIFCFVAGLWVRVLYPVLVGLVWTVAFLGNYGHFITPLLLAMTATMAAPWSSAWSVDALARGEFHGRNEVGKVYGAPIWLLGFVIGLTYTTAGLSKLVMTNGAWLWDTGARNGFIQDFGRAATDWGMVISNDYALALAASILSALGQAICVYACFARSTAIKFAMGAFVALPFLVGLVLFMGLFWWPWAILLLILYTPWRWIDRRLAPSATWIHLDGSRSHARQRTWFLAATATLVALHAFAVLSRTEREPLYSNYPMYAERMPAGSPHEAAFWSRFKRYDRHYRIALHAVSTAGTTDLSGTYALAEVFSRRSVWRADVIGLAPREVLARTSMGAPLGAELCERLDGAARSIAAEDAPVTRLLYAKRYFELADGRMTWVPVKKWVDVEVTAPGCPYRIASGAMQ
jgi:hypothetical protein